MKSAEIQANECLTFAERGLLFPIGVLSPAETRRFREACDRLEAGLGGRPRTIEVRQMHLHFSWAYELATAPAVLAAVEKVLGPDLLIWATELFAKHPRDPSVSIGWHRDQDYMGFEPPRAVTAWVALSPCTPWNGCLMALPRPEPPEVATAELAGGKSVYDEARLRDIATAVTLQPGEMSIHDSEILHGSSANRSDEKRVGFAIRFVAPSVRPRHGRPEVILARGEDRYGHFRVVSPQFPATDDEALRGLRQSALRHLDGILTNLRDRGGAEAGGGS